MPNDSRYHVACEIVVDGDSEHDAEETVRDILGCLIAVGDIRGALVAGVLPTPIPPTRND